MPSCSAHFDLPPKSHASRILGIDVYLVEAYERFSKINHRPDIR